MKYRKLGPIDNVSALGFGCMRLPKTGKFIWRKVDVDESIRIIRHGIDLGINYVDNAWFYHLGKSEKILGQALQDGYREKVKLVTKLPMILVRKTEDFYRYLDEQIKKLQTDYIDVYLLHSMNKKQFEKMKELNLIEKLEEAKASGKIKYIGFSFHDTLPVFKEIIDYYDWDVCQIQHNYMDTGIQATSEGLKYAADKGIGVIIMEPVKGGKLANPLPEVMERMNNDAPTKRKPVDWALQFLWNKPEVGVVLSGMSSQVQVDENCVSADKSGINSLSSEETTFLSEIAEIFRKKILVQCTACQYCMPCPSGVNIPENFAVLNDVSYRNENWMSKRKYKRLVKSKNLVNKKKPNGNASLCINCKQCVEKCPQSIDIPAELEKVDAILGEGKPISDFY
ncbi:MAG: aldo/keto reductase [archaeon]|nr:aldo/keto reductase [archaeon]